MNISKSNTLQAKKYATRIFLLLALGVFFYTIWKSKLDLVYIISSTDKEEILISVLLWSASHLVAPFFSSNFIQRTGYNFPYRTALDIHISLLPAKYLPGGIWHTIGRIGMMKSLDLPNRPITALVFLENLLPPVVTIIIGGLIVYLDAFDSIKSQWIPIAITIAMVSIIPILFILNKKILKSEHKITVLDLAFQASIVVVFWTLTSLSFITFLSAFSSVEITNGAIETAGIYLFSWGIGFISFFAPQGLGIFEAVAAILIQSNLSTEKLILVLALFRLVAIAGDLIDWAIWTGIKKLILKNQNAHPPRS